MKHFDSLLIRYFFNIPRNVQIIEKYLITLSVTLNF